MAKNRADRLKPVVDMALEAEREAARLLGKCQGLVNEAQHRLDDLQSYRLDYQNKWLEQGQHGVSGHWLVNYQRFLAQLDVAVDQQRNLLEWHKNNLSKTRDAWQKRYFRLKALTSLVEKYREEARKVEDKREQKQMDELSQRLIAVKSLE